MSQQPSPTVYMSSVLGQPISLNLVLKATSYGFFLILGSSFLRVARAFYNYRRRASHIPWWWDGQIAGSQLSIFSRLHPILITNYRSKLGGSIVHSNIGLNTTTGEIRPIVFIGPSIMFDPNVLVSDSRYFGEIMNDVYSIPKYKPFYSALSLMFGMGFNNLFTSAGETHTQQRKLTTPVFHFAALRISHVCN